MIVIKYMATLLNPSQQQNVSQQARLPVNNSNADQILSVTGANAWDGVIKYYNAGVLTTDAGQAAGTVVVIKLINNNILTSIGDAIGSYNDTSFLFTTGTILTTKKPFSYIASEQYASQSGTSRAQAITAGFANGEYTIDHESGTIYGVKATTGTTDTATYKIYTPATGGTAENVNVTAWGGTSTSLGQKTMAGSVPVVIASDQSITVTLTENTTITSGTKTVTTSGTAVALGSSTAINSVVITALLTNTDMVVIGGSTVDITTNPGNQLYAGSSIIIEIDNLSKVYVDAAVNGEGVSFNYLA